MFLPTVSGEEKIPSENFSNILWRFPLATVLTPGYAIRRYTIFSYFPTTRFPGDLKQKFDKFYVRIKTPRRVIYAWVLILLYWVQQQQDTDVDVITRTKLSFRRWYTHTALHSVTFKLLSYLHSITPRVLVHGLAVRLSCFWTASYNILLLQLLFYWSIKITRAIKKVKKNRAIAVARTKNDGGRWSERDTVFWLNVVVIFSSSRTYFLFFP